MLVDPVLASCTATHGWPALYGRGEPGSMHTPPTPEAALTSYCPRIPLIHPWPEACSQSPPNGSEEQSVRIRCWIVATLCCSVTC